MSTNNDNGRFSPQKSFDQGETEQVGGTVINRNLNRDEAVPDNPHSDPLSDYEDE